MVGDDAGVRELVDKGDVDKILYSKSPVSHGTPRQTWSDTCRGRLAHDAQVQARGAIGVRLGKRIRRSALCRTCARPAGSHSPCTHKPYARLRPSAVLAPVLRPP